MYITYQWLSTHVSEMKEKFVSRAGFEPGSSRNTSRSTYFGWNIPTEIRNTSWSTYSGRNIPTEIRRSIFDKPVLCPNYGIRKRNNKWRGPV